ncbi:hypothetical protein [Pseudomonas sp. WAC2]|uniref:hypothetical protein n=1 Tax=Pseudomonas sp. WAC2 TaxID=3055057 RepID=UPI0025AFB05A|nr:hypothetical protein [Pseudomonas sp. WAC2]MDN3237992.1 hypothetical protein [Pseudomonas sp. WAC2]
MRNKVIAGLLVLGAFLALTASGLLIYRAVYFASHTGSLLSASMGVALGAISLILTFKSLGEAGQDAENRVNKIKLAKPLSSVFLAFIGSLAAIHFAGLSVADYLQWLTSGLAMQHT